MAERILFITLLTMIIHTAETLSYSVRMAGIRTGKLAIAISLTGIIVLVSRTSNIAQGPVMGKIIGFAKLNSDMNLKFDFRLIIGAASLGTLLAIFLFPTFVSFSVRIISHLEMAGSFPTMISRSLRWNTIKNMRVHIRMPKWEMLQRLTAAGAPKRLMLINCLVTAIYTVGVLAALYATFLPGPNSYGASQSSGLINGFATILLTLLIDPQVALLTDKVMRSQVKRSAITHVFGYLMFSRFCGTLLAQLLFLPAAYFIHFAVRYF